jgi:DNA polymerase (family 10)
MTNQELAQKLKDLRDFLIIAGYPEGHATRYTHIARHIEKMAEPVTDLAAEGRLAEIPGVGALVKQYIKEILETGVSSKQTEFEKDAPISVLELVRIPGLGAKTARRLFQEFGITSQADLKTALEANVFIDVSGIGPKTLATWRAFVP